MFFTLGLTADFASAHRHEFSSPQTPPPQQQGISPRTRPFFSLPLPRSEVEAEDPSSPEPVPVPSKASLEEVLAEPELAMIDEGIDKSISESGLTRSNSTASITTAERRGKSTPRTRTLFQLAHPPPVISRPRLVVRPRLLLQVQKLSASARPVPAYDILPSSTTFLPRLSRRFPRFFINKDGLGPNDLLVVTSEDYASSSTTPGREDSSESSEDDGLGSRQVVSAIRQVKKGEGGGSGKVEICLGWGPVWEATPLANGGYELVARDENGLTRKARWVQRRPANRRRTSNQQSSTSPIYPDDDEKKFIFSIMNPDTRRHPIIATMNRKTIDIPDHYSLGSLSSGTHPPTSPIRTPFAMDSARTSYFEPTDRNLVRTDELLKTLIIVSGVWVAFREGWSQNFHYHDAASSPATASSPGSPTTARSARSVSNNEQRRTENGHRSTSDDFDQSHHSGLQSVGGRILRTGTHLLHRSSATQSSSVSEAATEFPPPRRANSTGTACLQRGHTRNRSHSMRTSNAFSSAPLGESDGEFDTSISTPSASTPTRSRRPTSLMVNGSHGSEQSALSVSTAGQASLQTASTNGARSGWATRSAYFASAPAMMDGAGGAIPPAPRKTQKTGGKEGEKKRWGMKGFFSMIRRSTSS